MSFKVSAVVWFVVTTTCKQQSVSECVSTDLVRILIFSIVDYREKLDAERAGAAAVVVRERWQLLQTGDFA